jgi:hypothetical protein
MNLICPHCRNTVTIPDHLAGQTTTCPQCRGPFTVPMLTTTPAGAAPPGGGAAGPGTFPVREERPPPVFSSAPPTEPPPLGADTEPAPLPTPTGEYRRRVSVTLGPRVVRWVTPVCFLLLFILLFFPWVGVYAGYKTIIRQTGMGVVFGFAYTEATLPATPPASPGAAALVEIDKPSFSALGFFYFLFVLLGVLASIFVAVVIFAPLPQFQQYLQWRSLALGGLSLAALFFLVLQLLAGFSLENKVMEKAANVHRRLAETDKNAAELTYGMIQQMLERRFWLTLTVLVNLVAVVASLADFWLERRPGRPLPRMELAW